MIGLLFSALTLAVGADTSNQYTKLFRRADSAFEAEFKDSIDMAKMTKAEAVKMLKNRKVYVAGKSAEIQKKLFWLGLKWCNDDTNISYVDRPFLYIYRDQIAWGENMVDFVESEFEEISAEEILSIDVDEGYEFEHLERVLVRDSEDNMWIPEFFLKKLDSRTYSFKCAYSTWNFCIPYKGNEHLVGTANSPKDKEE